MLFQMFFNNRFCTMKMKKYIQLNKNKTKEELERLKTELSFFKRAASHADGVTFYRHHSLNPKCKLASKKLLSSHPCRTHGSSECTYCSLQTTSSMLSSLCTPTICECGLHRWQALSDPGIDDQVF